MGRTGPLTRETLIVESLADYLGAPPGSWRHGAAEIWHKEWIALGLDAKSLALALEDASSEIEGACLVCYSYSGYGGDARQAVGEPKIFQKGRRALNAEDWEAAECLAQGCAGCAKLILASAERLKLDKAAGIAGQQAQPLRI